MRAGPRPRGRCGLTPRALCQESEPGRGDFHPLECSYGQFVRFWGNQCQHYTVPNDTDHTRMTIDFRIIPVQHFVEHYPNSHR